MDPALTDFAPQALALLAGGLLASLGPAWWARGTAGRARLMGIPTGRWRSFVGLLLIGPLIIAVLLIRPMLGGGGPGLEGLSALPLFALGLAVGLPMSIPALITARRDATRRQASLDRWKDSPAGPSDREAWAADLARMIEDAGPAAYSVTARATGQQRTILSLDGDLPRSSGELLTRALRDELSAAGFERVEGSHAGSSWWTRV